jgi:hypothetical protein
MVTAIADASAAQNLTAVIPAEPRERREPESITPTGSMDSGFADFVRAPE